MKKFAIAAVCLGFVAIAALLWLAFVMPARNAARNLAAVNGISVGKTTEADLLGRKEFQRMPRHCLQETCFYQMVAENTLLSALHFAPRTSIRTFVTVREGVVDEVAVWVMRSGLRPVTISQVKNLPRDCAGDPCVKLPPAIVPASVSTSVRILLGDQSDFRNHLPEAVNVQCLSRRTGCARYVEFVPLLQKLSFDESLMRAREERKKPYTD